MEKRGLKYAEISDCEDFLKFFINTPLIINNMHVVDSVICTGVTMDVLKGEGAH